MAKLKMKKYPKAPKQSASVAVKENHLARLRDVDKENARRKSENKKSEDLSKKITAVRSGRKK